MQTEISVPKPKNFGLSIFGQNPKKTRKTLLFIKLNWPLTNINSGSFRAITIIQTLNLKSKKLELCLYNSKFKTKNFSLLRIGQL